MQQYNVNKILSILKANNYKVFTRPYELNIVGIRSSAEPNKFDDAICVFYKDDSGKWIFKQYPITTDIGTYYMNHPMSSLGSAMLKEGQYIDTWIRGLHKGKYLALVQRKPVTTYRDFDRNAVFDFGQKQTTGMYGINIHKAGANSQDVNNWSAGCQVFQKTKDFDEFMAMTKKQADLYGNSFTYTLIDQRAIAKATRRKILYVALAVSIGFVGYKLYKNGSIPLLKKLTFK